MLRDVSDAEAGTVGSIAAMAVRQTPAERDHIAGALAGAGSSYAWRTFLDRGGPDIDSDVPSLKAGLSSSNAAVREATIWFVVSALASGRSLPIRDLTSALRAPDATLVTEESEWAGFGRELLARRFGKSAPADGAVAIQRHALKNSNDAYALASAPELTSPERTALRGVFPDLPPPGKGNRPSAPTLPVTNTKSVPLPMRTLTSLAPGFLSSLLAATECTPPSDSDAFGAARISYRPDGRPGVAAFDTATLRPACALFVKSLAALTVPRQDEPIVDGVPHWLYMAMDKDAISCADGGSSPSPGDPAYVGGKIKPPRKTKNVTPIYPQSMQTNRVEGVVVIEATISASGCVTGAKVRRSVAIPLDLAALQAVLGWRFTPTLLDEKPVPVIMTVTVNFRLQ
jgi:TonB family protein